MNQNKDNLTKKCQFDNNCPLEDNEIDPNTILKMIDALYDNIETTTKQINFLYKKLQKIFRGKK